jgi:hypothetical protein
MLLMSSINYQHDAGDEFVTEEVETGAQTAEVYGHLPYRVAHLSSEDGQLVNDGTDTETVTVELRDGLEIARGTDPANAALVAESRTVVVEIDGAEQSVDVTDGSGTVDLSTQKSAGSTITVEAVWLSDGPALNTDSIEIEVIA